jgi:hypothetical protein
LKTLGKVFFIVILLPCSALAQDDDNWPPRSYLRSDYREVAVVAHIRIQHAKITARIPGLVSWTIVGEVLEPFKGKFKKGDTIEYGEGAEDTFNNPKYFSGEKLVFLLAERDREGKVHYSALENSSLPYNEDRAKKLRSIKRSYQSKQKRRSRNHSSGFATTFAQ